jgi:Icc protein
MLIAQLSDLHVTADGAPVAGRVNTNALAERAIGALLRLTPRPDIVVISGDLAENGTPDDYAAVHRLLAQLSMPVYVVPGNHDRREAMRTAFAGDGYLQAHGPLNFVVEAGPLRLIGLDSLVEGEAGGALTADTLAFLQQALSAHPAVPTFVMVHHPPVDCGIDHMDRMRLINGARELEQILIAHPHVQRLVTGHVHRPIQTLFAGTLCQIAPSVAHQVTLDLTPGGPACFTLEPPAFLLHQWREVAGLVTQMAYVDPAPGPFAF